MLLYLIAHNFNSTEDTSQFTGIPPHIIIMSDIEGLNHEIKSLKGTNINQIQYEMDKRVLSSTYHNTKTIVDSMVSQTKQITEEIVGKTEVITSKVTEGSGTDGSNIMDITIDKEE